MNTIDINKYTARIRSKETELIRTLHNGVSHIVIPSAPSDNTVDSVSSESKSDGPNKGIMAVGGGLSFIGLFCNSPLNWILILGGLATCAYGYSHRGPHVASSSQQVYRTSPVDHSSLVSQINIGLNKVNRDISENWDNFISQLKEGLKNEIMQLDVDVDKKSRMMDAATLTAVMEFSMSSLFAKLSDAANRNSISAFKAVVNEFEQNYKAVIANTCAEQIRYWSNI